MVHFNYDFKSVLLWSGATLLNVFDTIKRTDISFALGILSTSVVVVYHLIKIRKELRNK